MSAAPGIVSGGVSAKRTFRDLVMDLGPHLYYPMDEDTGSLTTIEEIVQGQNVTGGPFDSWGEPLVEGDSASAVFDRNNDLATYGSVSTNGGSFSYMALLEPTQVSAQVRHIVDSVWWTLRIRSGNLRFYVKDLVSEDTNYFPVGYKEKTLAIITFDDAANRIYVYKNGSLFSQQSQWSSFPSMSTTRLLIGNRTSGTDGYGGSMAHLAYFGRALTPTEVSDLWTAVVEGVSG